MDWLLAPIDPLRAHEVGFAVSWHGRSMVLAWGILVPLAIVIARFFKIMPGQDWPRELDSQVWWRTHWMVMSLVAVITVFGYALILPQDAGMSVHTWLGYILLATLAAQVLLGIFRGSKGGPTAPGRDGSLHGHHYDMTPWRRQFERMHKSLGYAALLLAVAVLFTGIWRANAPIWMWLSITSWWIVLLVCARRLQSRGMAIDTYQAIWGDDPSLPGNRLPAPGWGVRRPGDIREEEQDDVRGDRGDRIRSH